MKPLMTYYRINLERFTGCLVGSDDEESSLPNVLLGGVHLLISLSQPTIHQLLKIDETAHYLGEIRNDCKLLY